VKPSPWAPPPLWSVPRTWAGERAFVLCGGPSLRAQRDLVPQLRGRVVAVKEGVLLRPDADVLFFAGEHAEVIAPPLLRAFKGQHVVVRGKGHPVFPPTARRVWRTPTHEAWSTDPTMVAGFDAGTSAINLAMLFGAREIVLLGYDMGGGRWFTPAEHPHPLPQIPEARHQQHMAPLRDLALDAFARGVRIVNCSPTSRATCFSYQPLESFL
jgi:hypothetical protein